jgi:hypothetical protein
MVSVYNSALIRVSGYLQGIISDREISLFTGNHYWHWVSLHNPKTHADTAF